MALALAATAITCSDGSSGPSAPIAPEAVLESDDEPLMRKPSAKKDKAGDEIVNGMETEDRQTVIKSETPLNYSTNERTY